MALPTGHLKPLIHFMRAQQGSTHYQVSLPKVKQWRWEIDHSPPPRTETKNEWTYISVCSEWRESITFTGMNGDSPQRQALMTFLAHSWLTETHQHIFCTASLFLNIYGSLLFPETRLPSKFPILRHYYSTDMDKTKYVADLFIEEQPPPVINNEYQSFRNNQI